LDVAFYSLYIIYTQNRRYVNMIFLHVMHFLPIGDVSAFCGSWNGWNGWTGWIVRICILFLWAQNVFYWKQLLLVQVYEQHYEMQQTGAR